MGRFFVEKAGFKSKIIFGRVIYETEKSQYKISGSPLKRRGKLFVARHGGEPFSDGFKRGRHCRGERL